MQELSHEYAINWYNTPSSFEKAGGLWPIRVGRNHAKPNYKVGPRFISIYSLHFVLEGKGIFSQADVNDQIESGDIFCLFPNVTHVYQTDPDHLLKMAWFSFDGRQSTMLLNRAGIRKDRPLVKKMGNAELLSFVEEISRAFIEQTDLSDLEHLGLLYRLFDKLSQEARRLQLVKDETNRWVDKAKTYMDVHYAEGISVEDVARYVGIHRSHFSSTFSRMTGQKPVEYLQSLKMNKAKQMLGEHIYSVTEIALSLGYPDLYSFSRAFKNYFGHPPSFYQRNKD